MDELPVLHRRTHRLSSISTRPTETFDLIAKTKAAMSAQQRRHSVGSSAMERRRALTLRGSCKALESDSDSGDDVERLPRGTEVRAKLSEAATPTAAAETPVWLQQALDHAVALVANDNVHSKTEFKGCLTQEWATPQWADDKDESFHEMVERVQANKDELERIAKERFGANVMTLDSEVYDHLAFEATQVRLKAKIAALEYWRSDFLDATAFSFSEASNVKSREVDVGGGGKNEHPDSE